MTLKVPDGTLEDKYCQMRYVIKQQVQNRRRTTSPRESGKWFFGEVKSGMNYYFRLNMNFYDKEKYLKTRQIVNE